MPGPPSPSHPPHSPGHVPTTTYKHRRRRLSKQHTVAQLPLARTDTPPPSDFLLRRHDALMERQKWEADRANELKQNTQHTDWIDYDPPINCIRVHLPNMQCTIVRRVRGRSLSRATRPALVKRGLSPSGTVAVYAETREPIGWDTDLAAIKADQVRIMLPFSLLTGPYEHNHQLEQRFVMFFHQCNVCQRSLLIHMLACAVCSFKCHRSCRNASRALGGCYSSINRRANRQQPAGVVVPAQAVPDNAVVVPPKEPDNVDAVPAAEPADPAADAENAAIAVPDVNDGAVDQASGDAAVDPPANPDNAVTNCLSPATRSDWLIESDFVKMFERIGRGSFGFVHRAKWFGCPVAVKKLKLNIPPSVAQLDDFRNEVKMLRTIDHLNVLTFMGAITTPFVAIVTEWCDGCTLYEHLHVSETHLSLTGAIEISLHIAEGMHYLHNTGIIHRDLKSKNVFLLSGNWVKIGDFGLAMFKTTGEPVKKPAKMVEEQMMVEEQKQHPAPVSCSSSDAEQQEHVADVNVIVLPQPVIGSSPIAKQKTAVAKPKRYINQPSGSILWMAPEVIRMDEPHSVQSDVYAFGVVLFEQMAEQLPYGGINNRDRILYQVGRGDLRPDLRCIVKPMPQPLRLLLQACLRFESAERPNFTSVLKLLKRALAKPQLGRSSSDPTLMEMVAEEAAEEANYAAEATLAQVAKTGAAYFNAKNYSYYHSDREKKDKDGADKLNTTMDEKNTWYL